jgi:F-type H+-transporting ATPase subunit b
MPDFIPEYLLRSFRILLLTVFLSGMAAMPFQLVAQEPAPAADAATQTTAAAPASASASTETAKAEAPDAEQAQTNAFRLEGPLVKWTAKTLHVSVEATATGFEIVNFLIVVLGLGIPLFRFLPKFLRNRSEKLRADIESARKVTEDANARLSAIEAKLSGLDGEIGKIRAQVEAESRLDEARIKSTIKEESDRVVAAAEQEIGSAAAQARRSLRHFAADLAIDQAAKQLVFTPETDRALIAEFLGDVAKGGQN